jgi:hypothetical protein
MFPDTWYPMLSEKRLRFEEQDGVVLTDVNQESIIRQKVHIAQVGQRRRSTNAMGRMMRAP